MFKLFFLTAVRSFRRNLSGTAINVTGLMLGIISSFIIIKYVSYEASFDRFHSNYDNIYRVTQKYKTSDDEGVNYAMPRPLGDAMKHEYPDIPAITTTIYWQSGLVLLQDVENLDNGRDKFLLETGVAFLEPEFFEIFDAKWISGSPEESLLPPNRLVLTRSLAELFYGTTDVIGRKVSFNNNYHLTVSGVIEDFPENTDLPFSFIMSMATYRTANAERMDNWRSISTDWNVYMLLPDGTAPEKIEKRFPAFVEKYNKPKPPRERSYHLQTLEDVHFNTEFGNYNYREVSKTKLAGLSAIAVFLILIGCINFINLLTSQAVLRSKEIGIRKTLGSSRWAIVAQIFIEITIITFAAIILSVILMEVLFPILQSLLNLHFPLEATADPVSLLLLLGIGVVVILFSGAYPALLLSGFKPVTALSSKMSRKKGGGLALRRGLVVFQFFVSQVLLIAMFVVNAQMNYIGERDPGFTEESVISVTLPRDTLRQDPFLQKLSLTEGVESVSLSMDIPMNQNYRFAPYRKPEWEKNERKSIEIVAIDEHYLDLFEIQILSGRNFYEKEKGSNILINESFLRELGYNDPEEAVNQQLIDWDEKPRTIIGVIADYHGHSYHNEVSPQIYAKLEDKFYFAHIKYASSDLSNLISNLEETFDSTYPEYLFEYHFLDEHITGFYEEEQMVNKLFIIFSGIAILIGCLGLYGLISFIAARRTKEIGIRKVLGATGVHIIISFFKEFGILIGIAFLVAAPVGYYMMTTWLEDFAYKISIGVEIFFYAIFSTLLIASAAILFRAYKAASANPVDSLKYE